MRAWWVVLSIAACVVVESPARGAPVLPPCKDKPTCLNESSAEFVIAKDGQVSTYDVGGDSDTVTLDVEIDGTAIVSGIDTDGKQVYTCCAVVAPGRKIGASNPGVASWLVTVRVEHDDGPGPPIASAMRPVLAADGSAESEYIDASLVKLVGPVDTITTAKGPDDEAALAAAHNLTFQVPVHGDITKLDEIVGDAIELIAAGHGELPAYPVAHSGLAARRSMLVAIGWDAYQIAAQDSKFAAAAFHDLKQLASRLRDIGIAAVKPSAQDICGQAAQYNVAKQPRTAASWPFGTFVLPARSIADLIEIDLGIATGTERNMTDQVTAWVTRVPREQAVNVQWVQGSSTVTTFTAVVTTLFSFIFTGKAPGTTYNENTNRVWDLELNAHFPEGVQEMLNGLRAFAASPDTSVSAEVKLAKLTTRDYCRDHNIVANYADPFGPIAPFTSFLSKPTHLTPDHNYKVQVCPGTAACASDSAALGTRQLTPPTHLSWALLGWVGWTGQFTSHPGDWRISEFTEDAWEPTSSLGGGQQLYRLTAVKHPLDSLTTAISVGGRWSWWRQKFAAGIGPALTFASGSAKLSQWTVNGFWEVPTLGTYVTVGLGVRLVDVATGYAPDTVMQGTSVPTLVTTQDHAWVISFGVGWDLSTIIGTTGDALKSLFSLGKGNGQ